MREIRQSGSEGGARFNPSFLPLSLLHTHLYVAARQTPVRLRVSVHRRVRVPLWRSFPPETESNCVVATRGGEQLEVNG
jgi:hypothetical protein